MESENLNEEKLFINVLTGMITNMCNELAGIRKEFKKFNLMYEEAITVCDSINEPDIETDEISIVEPEKKIKRCSLWDLKELILSLSKEFTFFDLQDAMEIRGYCNNNNNVRHKLTFCLNYGVIGETDNGTYINLYKSKPEEFTFNTPQQRNKFREMNSDKGFANVYNLLHDNFTRDDTKRLCGMYGLDEGALSRKLCELELFGFVERKDEQNFKKKENL